MTKLSTLASLAVITWFATFSINASAQDRGILFSRAGGNGRAVSFGNQARQQLWKNQVKTRALTDSFVYRSEGKATTRHDEVSSPEVIFHTVKGGRVKAGHVFQRRAK